MRTVFYIVSCLLIAGFAAWSYNVNLETRSISAKARGLEASISAEKEKIDVLQAEWAYLNRPERLIRLAEANFGQLGLLPLSPDNLADARDVAYPVDDIDLLVNMAVMTAASEGDQ